MGPMICAQVPKYVSSVFTPHCCNYVELICPKEEKKCKSPNQYEKIKAQVDKARYSKPLHFKYQTYVHTYYSAGQRSSMIVLQFSNYLHIQYLFEQLYQHPCPAYTLARNRVVGEHISIQEFPKYVSQLLVPVLKMLIVRKRKSYRLCV